MIINIVLTYAISLHTSKFDLSADLKKSLLIIKFSPRILIKKEHDFFKGAIKICFNVFNT